MAEIGSDAEMHIDNEDNDVESDKVNGAFNGSAELMDTSECASPTTSVDKNLEENCEDEESNSQDNLNNEHIDFNPNENSNKSFDDKDDSKSCDNDENDASMSRPDSVVSENLSRNHNTDSQASNHSISSNGSSQQEFSNGKNKENSNDTQSSTSAKQEDGILIPSDSEDEVEALDEDTEEEEDMVSNGVSVDEPMSIHSDSEDECVTEAEPNKTDDNKQLNGNKDSTDVHEIESDKEDCVINLDTPEKEVKEKPAETTPRRSSRNITRKKYSEDFEQDLDFHKNVESDLEEVAVADPLGDSSSNRSSKQKNKSVPIVVKDTKRLVEITTKNMTPNSTANNKSGKKSPTLVIIDTNSILSGRGPVPMGTTKQSFSVMPVAVPAQGMYPANIRGATITPVNNTTVQKVNQTVAPVASVPSLVLPNLTDDMFVVEAPSFIVPYVYEKPPTEPFREFVDKMGKEVEEARKLEEEQEKLNETKEEKEKENDEQNNDENKEPEIKKKSKKKRRKEGDDDESWDENDTSDTEDEDDVDGEKVQKEVLVKDIKEDSLEAIKKHIITPDSVTTVKPVDKKSDSYFDNPIGKFFMNIGINLVQEYVQTDLLKQQKRKRDRENKTSTNSTATQMAINSLIKNLEFSKENNEPYHFEQKRCEICNFKTESSLALAHHMETPHMRNYFYRCNFCPFEIRSPHDILIHMEVEHKTKGRLERAASYHQCPNCPFEDNGKAKLARHQLACAKKFKPEVNLGPPLDWEPPAKIPRTSRPKQSLTSAASAYQQAMANQARIQPAPVSKMTSGSRGRGRPALNKALSVPTGTSMIRGNMMYRTNVQNSNQLLLPNNYSYNANQLMQVVGTSVNMLPGTMVATSSGSVTIQTTPSGSSKATNNSKILHQPSISITPLPRQSVSSSSTSNSPTSNANKPGQQATGKAAFVICEICDGYIKDLDQLRNHMQWIHKVKIHPKMIYNRPPLNCQKCQFRFFTDQGLERHLLGSHGLVTSSMQEAANKGKDAGRCPVCGRVYQWKLLNHVNRDHNMTLKPAHLSYKCTVCTATFGMYKQFENHVYSAHSVVAKKVMDKKATPGSGSSSSPLNKGGDSLLKPLKINDEITIIPQPPKPRPGPASRTAQNSSATLTVTKK